MNRELTGKVAFVTGAGSGIGQGAALRLAEAGAKVAILGRRPERLEPTVAEIEKKGGEAYAIRCDVGIESDVQEAYAEAESRWDRVDIVVANAGINGVWAKLDELDLDEWNATIQANLTGTFLTVKHAVRPLRKVGGGSVIIVSSINGNRCFNLRGTTAYSTSKAGQVAFAKIVAPELALEKIRVNVICPGSVKTSIGESTHVKGDLEVLYHPNDPKTRVPVTQGAAASTSQVGDLVQFLASDRSSHIAGTEIYIDGAESLI